MGAVIGVIVACVLAAALSFVWTAVLPADAAIMASFASGMILGVAGMIVGSEWDLR